jgi:glycosyltransferase involved in cell wall biosynthesis
MTGTPEFSIVIPAFNRADLIGETVDSVLNQDFADYEIIIIDDGSTDATEPLIKDLYSHLPNLRYIKESNRERGAARNSGFFHARGRYVFFLDSDDLLLRNHLRTLFQLTRRYPGARLISTKYQFLRQGRLFPSDVAGLPEGFYGIDLVLKGNPLTGNLCLRKENEHLRLFQEDRRLAVNEDWIFYIENLMIDTILIADAVTITVRDHPGRSMRKDNREIIRGKLAAMDWIVRSVPLTQAQKNTLTGYGYYFCAIHSYLGNDGRSDFQFIWKAGRLLGPIIKLLVLAAKIPFGRKFLSRLEFLRRDAAL